MAYFLGHPVEISRGKKTMCKYRGNLSQMHIMKQLYAFCYCYLPRCAAVLQNTLTTTVSLYAKTTCQKLLRGDGRGRAPLNPPRLNPPLITLPTPIKNIHATSFCRQQYMPPCWRCLYVTAVKRCKLVCFQTVVVWNYTCTVCE